jgi:hypothetical protein
MKKVSILLLVLATSLALGAKPLRTFESLMDTLKGGNAVRVVVDYGQCKLLIDGKEEKSPEAIGGMDWAAWEYFAKGVIRNEKAYVVSSHTQLIAHPRYGHVHNYVRIRVFEDGEVNITARYLRTGTFEVVMDETFVGKLDKGVRAYRD